MPKRHTRAAKDLPANIVEAWIAFETDSLGHTVAAALRDLNAECGTSYRANNVSEWRRGLKTPTACALRYMALLAVPHILIPFTGRLDDDEAEAIAAAFSPPERVKE